jgi:hypothetical protein
MNETNDAARILSEMPARVLRVRVLGDGPYSVTLYMCDGSKRDIELRHLGASGVGRSRSSPTRRSSRGV